MGFQYGFFPILERQYGNDLYGGFSANMGVLLPIWEVFSHIGYFWDLWKDYFSVSRVCIPIWDSISNMGNIFPIWIFFKVMSQLIFYLYQWQYIHIYAAQYIYRTWKRTRGINYDELVSTRTINRSQLLANKYDVRASYMFIDFSCEQWVITGSWQP